MLKRNLLLILTVLHISSTQAQQVLQIGDTIPNLPIEKVWRSNAKFKNTSELKGKFLLIDFWNINCTSCLRAMPYMDSLQKEFGERLNILMVTNNSKSEVTTFYSKHPQIKIPSYAAVIVADSVLTAAFPHNSVPHHIWIDDKGVVKYITDGHYATKNNVQSFLKKVPLNMRMKREYADFDLMQPLIKEGNGRLQPHLKYYSTFFKRISEYGSGAITYFVDTINYTAGVKLINQPLLEHYKFAYSKLYGGIYYEANRIALEVKDKSSFIIPETTNEEWLDKNIVSYELSVPLSRKDHIFHYVQEDLDRYFPYSAELETKVLQSFVLTQIDKKLSFKPEEEKPAYIKRNDSLIIKNYKLETLRSALAYSLSKYNCPVINAIDYSGTVNITLLGDLSDIGNINRQLKTYGLLIEKKDHCVKQLIIRDK